jgi:hypothetical protein
VPIYSFGVNHPLKMILKPETVAAFNAAEKKIQENPIGQAMLTNKEFFARDMIQRRVDMFLEDARDELVSEAEYENLIPGDASELVENVVLTASVPVEEVVAAISSQGLQKALSVAAFAGVGLMLFNAFRNGDFDS